MLPRLAHASLRTCCILCALSVLLLTLVLVYDTDPTQFTWRAISGQAAVGTATDASPDGEDACDPIILARAPIGFPSIADFATEAVLAINSYDYLGWDQSLPAALNTYFTPSAARSYYGQFSRSGLLRTVTSSYYTVSALSVRPAMIVASSHVEGVRSWTVQVPITVRYQTGVTNADGGATVQAQHEVFVVTVLEQRPNQQNFRGVAINDITTERVPILDELDKLERGQ